MSPPDDEVPDSSTDPSIRLGSRRFAIGGEHWLVYEDTKPVNGPALVFESHLIARRVRVYPATWRDLSDADLYVLSWRK